MCWWWLLPPSNFTEIRSVFVRSEINADVVTVYSLRRHKKTDRQNGYDLQCGLPTAYREDFTIIIINSKIGLNDSFAKKPMHE